MHRRLHREEEARPGALSRRFLSGADVHHPIPDGETEHEADSRIRATEVQVPGQHQGVPPKRAGEPGEGAAARRERRPRVLQTGHLS